ncbi:MAG: FecR domain-containing protein [Steroidobacteraceae bacterium]
MTARDSRFNRQIAEEAAEWFVDFSVGDVDSEQRARFHRWLRTSPVHVRAYLQVTAIWEEADLLELTPEAMEELARQVASGVSVVPLRAAERAEVARSGAAMGDQPHTPATPGFRPRLQWRHMAVAASVALLGILIGAVLWMRQDQGVSYATAIGEQRIITLADGSVVKLNSRSRLRVSFSEQLRSVELFEGQALFEVAKNPRRPFVVTSGKTSVRAVGTQFDVYRKGAGTVVTVVEGQVAVSGDASLVGASSRQEPIPSATGAGAGGAVLLSAGEQVVVMPAAPLAPQSVNVEATTAWTQNKLVFDAAPLSEVVAEFNRYSPTPLVIEDPALDQVRISGVFTSTSVDHLVEFLEQRFAAEAQLRDGQLHLVSRP